MNYHKKISAFIMSILICMTASPIFSHADNEDEVSEDEIMLINLEDEEHETDTEEVSTSATESNDGEKISGDFTYTVDEDGNAHITACSSNDETIVVPDELDGIKVTEIEAKAFMGRHAKKIVIPASVEYISSNNPFAPCEQLEEVEIDSANENYCSVDGVVFSKDMKKIICYPSDKSGTSYNVPDGVEKIGIAALAENKLKEITVPDSIKEIDRHAFSYDENLEKLDLSKTTITSIEVMLFANCTSLKEVLLPDTVHEIKIAAFIGCESLGEITLPSELESIGQSAFMGTGLKKVRIPETVTDIGYSAFGYDINEVIDSSFTIIGKSGSMAQRYATDQDTEYGYVNDFIFVPFETADAEEEYNAMNPIAYGDYEYAVIDGEARILFCVSMDETVTVPEEIEGYKVTSIYKGAFLNCEAKNIIFPETVKTIDEAVFSEYVESITIPSGCTSIGGDEPFISCKNLREINVTEGGDGEYSSLDGVLYNKDKTVLIAYPIQKSDTSFKAPSALTEIAMSAFCYNTFLEDADLSGVATINHYAFEGCENLKSVKFSDDIKLIGNDVFLDNNSLKSVRLPADIEMIGDYAFGYYFDSTVAGTSENQEELPFKLMDGFKIYADEESMGWKYAKACGIEVVTNTTEIGSKNVDNNFLYVIGGSVGAVALLSVGIAAGKKMKKKKGSKK